LAKKKKKIPLSPKNRGLKLFLTAILLIIGCCITYISQNQPLPEGTVEIRFLDVGQGDSTFIVTEEGCILIDTGESSAKQTVYFEINSYGNRLEYLIISHPHTDHMGGAAYILDKMEVGTVILPRSTSSDDAYVEFLDSVSESGASVLFADPGLDFTLGEARFTVLAPLEEHDDLNDTSAVIRMDFGKISALFTGDAEAPSERDQLERYGSFPGSKLDVDILKVGHHGSSSSSTENYIRAVTPQYAVISCGKDNSYGHPASAVTERLQRFGSDILRTDRLGTISFYTDGENISINEPLN